MDFCPFRGPEAPFCAATRVTQAQPGENQDWEYDDAMLNMAGERFIAGRATGEWEQTIAGFA